MPALSRITTHRWPWIRGVCSSWDGASPIIPMIARKPNPRWLPFHRRSACPRRRHSTLATFVLRPWLLLRSAALSPTSPRAVILIIQARHQRYAPLPDPPSEDASSQVKMAYKLRTALGKAIYGARKCTVEPVIGIIKEVLGFRQFSLRGIQAAAGEWCLVCLAFNLKRFHILSGT